ncbi:MAG: hypothetical protein AB1730_27980 [Myxococcota bacterium]
MTTKIERATSLPSTPRTQQVSRTPAAAQVEARPVAPATAFTGTEAPRALQQPAGQHVAKSADPDALWGAPAPRAHRRFDLAGFQKLSPAERKAKLQELRAQQANLKQDIEERVGQLDRKWNSSRLKTRTASMRDLQQKAPQLTGDQAQRLDAALKAAEAAEQKVNALAEKAKAFTPESKRDPAQAEARARLARELRKARAEQSAAVRAATAVLDEAGLKVDRLANAEQVLDRNAPAPGSGESLWDKVVSFFELSWLVDVFSGMLDLLREMERDREVRAEADRADREIEFAMKQQLDRALQKERIEASDAKARAQLLERVAAAA